MGEVLQDLWHRFDRKHHTREHHNGHKKEQGTDKHRNNLSFGKIRNKQTNAKC